MKQFWAKFKWRNKKMAIIRGFFKNSDLTTVERTLDNRFVITRVDCNFGVKNASFARGQSNPPPWAMIFQLCNDHLGNFSTMAISPDTATTHNSRAKRCCQNPDSRLVCQKSNYPRKEALFYRIMAIISAAFEKSAAINIHDRLPI